MKFKFLLPLLTVLCFFAPRLLSAQDTTVIQTLTFSSTTRAGHFDFPPDTTTWSKIIMRYTMRCKDGLVSTSADRNKGCGEWDYSCNTYITDSTYSDSLKSKHKNYTISNFGGQAYPYTDIPVYAYTQYAQPAIVYSAIANETFNSVGSGNVNLNHPYASGNTSGKSQYVWTVAELTTAGLTAGAIDGIALNIGTLGGDLNFLRVKMKHFNANTLSQIEPAGFQQVYFSNTLFAGTGFQRLNFYQPFVWNGTDNILVELNYNNDIPFAANVVKGANAANKSLTNPVDDYAVSCDGFDDFIRVEDLDDLDGVKKFTYEGWVNIKNWKNWVNIFGKSDRTLLQTGDSPGNLYCIIRNPSNTYGWAAGVLPLNTWTHVAMVYDATQSGNANRLKMYINGAQVTLTYNGNIPDSTDINTEAVRIASISGMMDDARIWKTALSGTTIADWMYKQLASTHPNYNDLIVNLEMNEGMGSDLTDSSPAGNDAILPNGGFWQKFKGNDIFKGLTNQAQRPNLRFYQISGTSSLDTSLVVDSTLLPPNTVISYAVQNNNLIATDTTEHWLATYTLLKDENGAVLDTIWVNAADTLNLVDLTYYSKTPMKYEMVSFVTPYGIGINFGMSGKYWDFDVTDYAPILKNRRYLNMQWGGEYQEQMDIKFLFIKGTPPRNVLSIQQIWPVTADNYQTIMADNRFEPRDVLINPNATSVKILTAVTGHGQEGEFIPRDHFINLNGGNKEYVWQIWKECAYNPVKPQGGTWVYDRAGWCPGAPTDVKEMNITNFVTPGQTINIDYGVNTASGDSRYIVSNQIIQYGPVNFSLDAAIVRTLRPSNYVEDTVMNPACMDPTVRIKNQGTTPLTSLLIEYGMAGTTPNVYTWTGNLAFNQTANVKMPLYNWSNVDGEFVVSLKSPNGGTDQNPLNDVYRSRYVKPKYLPGKLVVLFKSNKNPFENYYTIKDHTGNVVFSAGGFQQNTAYYDTLDLPAGCYEFRFTDEGQDGINWWANPSQGAGYVQFRNPTTGLVNQTFNPDFGAEIFFQFMVDPNVDADATNLKPKNVLEVFPNPAKDKVNFHVQLADLKTATLHIMDLSGRIVRTFEVKDTYATLIETELQGMSSGVYVALLQTESQTITQKFIVE